ncbi:MAG: MarR family winged helix-turn-helix transcriptional regulator [Chloroflexota bacterium]
MEHAELLAAIQRALRALSARSVLFSQAIAERLGLNASDLECLGFLFDEGSATAGRLAELTGLTTGAITGVVDRLEKAGYVRREKDPNDRRRVIVQPNLARAEQELGPLFAPIGQEIGELCAGYGDEQLATILDFATRALPIIRAETRQLRQGEGLSAPLGAVAAGRLIFASVGMRLVIRASSATTDLYRARFEGPPPSVDVEGGTVTFHYRFGLLDWRKRAGEIELNPTIPWQVEFHGGASKVNADLRDLRIQSVSLAGGASDVSVTLPEPVGTVPVGVAGGANEIRFTRPAGVAARVAVVGGYSMFTFDGQDQASGVGGTSRATLDFGTAVNRYDVTIEGGANHVAIDAARE